MRAKHFGSVKELIRMALIYAIQDREAMVDATCQDDPEHADAKAEVAELKAYYRRHYGRTPDDIFVANSTTITLSELQRRHED